MYRDKLYDLLDEVLSYPVPGSEFSEKYQMGVWDGRARLHNRPRGTDCVRFPAGMVDKVAHVLKREGHTFSIAQDPPEYSRTARLGSWTGPKPYPHQRVATRAVLERYARSARSAAVPPGTILRLPVRSGKTLTSALISHYIGANGVLFVVPSEYLLHQAQENYAEYLDGITIGQFAAGKRDLDADVIVATAQTIYPAVTTRFFNKLRKQRRLLIIDEVHHKGNEGKVWRQAVLDLNPSFTLGLSATFEMFEEPEEATSMIWLRGLCGPIGYSMTLSELIEKRYLVRPTIHWFAHNAPKLPSKTRSGPQLYKDGIVDCTERNRAIVDIAAKWARDHRILIDVERVGHTRSLTAALRKRLPSRQVASVTGATKPKARKKIVESLRRGEIRVVIGTVLGEGVDIPELDVVINAEGGRGYIPTMQRLRCLTPCEGKTKAHLIDFIDDHDSKLLASTKARQAVYSGEPAFRFKYHED